MSNVFNIFNEKFFKSRPEIKWFDKDGVYKIDEDRVVVITIDDKDYTDHFGGYLVKVINKMNGTIVSKWFPFKYYLTMIHREGDAEYFYALYTKDKFDWYISRPKSTDEMVDCIFEWIENFK